MTMTTPIFKHITTNAVIPDPNDPDIDTTVNYFLLAKELDDATQDPQFAGLQGEWVARYWDVLCEYGPEGQFCSSIEMVSFPDVLVTEHIRDVGQAHPFTSSWSNQTSEYTIAHAALESPDGKVSAVILTNLPELP